jgi:hypothetical protein
MMMTIGAAKHAAGGKAPESLAVRRVPGAHLPEFPAGPVWVRADLALLERVRAALADELDGDGR